MKNKLVNTYVKNQFPDYSVFVIPAFREQCQDTGRPKDGITQLSRKNINVKQTCVPSYTSFSNYKVTLAEHYFPNDPMTIAFNNDDLLSVLNEVEYILDTCEFGDLNWDPSHQTGFS